MPRTQNYSNKMPFIKEGVICKIDIQDKIITAHHFSLIFLFIFLLNSAVSFHFKHLPSGCTLGYQGVYQMNIFAKQSCIPKKMLPLYLTMRPVSGWSDKALYPPIWQIWNDSDPIFHLLSLCLLGLAPTRTIRSPSQKKTQMFSFNRAGAGSQFNKGHTNYVTFLYFSFVDDKNDMIFLYLSLVEKNIC